MLSELIELDFPEEVVEACAAPDNLAEILNIDTNQVIFCGKNRLDLLVGALTRLWQLTVGDLVRLRWRASRSCGTLSRLCSSSKNTT